MLVQKRAGVPEADLLIAATSADEVNMLALPAGEKARRAAYDCPCT